MAGTLTPIRRLYRPVDEERGWGDLVSGNFTTLDDALFPDSELIAAKANAAYVDSQDDLERIARIQAIADAIDRAQNYTDEKILELPPVDISGKADTTYVDSQDASEAASRIADDAATLASAIAAIPAPVDISGKADTTYVDSQDAAEATARAAADTTLTTAVAGKQAALGFTPENAANKDAASGYAGLDAGGKLKTTEAPTWNQNTSGTAANLSGTPALPNGTTATTQAAGDNSNKVATTQYADAPIAGGTPIKNIPFGTGVPMDAGPGTSIFGLANTQEEIYFVNDDDFTITNLYFSLNTGVNGAKFGIAILSADRLSKLTSADAIDVSVANQGQLKVVLSGSITLKRKTGYWLVWTATTNTTLSITNVLMTAAFQNLYNKNLVRSGTSANATSGGNTAANNGAVSSAQLRIPYIFFD